MCIKDVETSATNVRAGVMVVFGARVCGGDCEDFFARVGNQWTYRSIRCCLISQGESRNRSSGNVPVEWGGVNECVHGRGEDGSSPTIDTRLGAWYFLEGSDKMRA